MEWKYVKPLVSSDLIEKYETMVHYQLCASYKQCVLEYNGGRPKNRAFDTDKTAERELKTFLSFNPDDIENVWDVCQWNKEELSDKYIPFAIDGFGNLICFDRHSNMVIFLNHETLATEHIANGFDEFMNCLYD